MTPRFYPPTNLPTMRNSGQLGGQPAALFCWFQTTEGEVRGGKLRLEGVHSKCAEDEKLPSSHQEEKLSRRKNAQGCVGPSSPGA
jgi:hypothetical protein